MASKSLLADTLEIKPSQLYVKDLQKLTKFYKDIVGLELLNSTPSHAILGQGNTPVLELISKPEYNHAPIKSAGLFHNAILYSSRAELAKALYSILTKMPEAYEGPGDHLVSQAFYFHDPENNGLELYFDRPRETWKWENGQIKMDTLYIDVEQFILQHIGEAVDPIKKLGHVHLRVGDIPTAKEFYVEKLGFDQIVNLESALFVSVGGYHHHLGMNTWASKGASFRDPSLGLAEVKIELPRDGSLNSLTDRLENHELKYEIRSDNIALNDPWGNRFVFSE
jgi:catechol 2,3-dioxygenase